MIEKFRQTGLRLDREGRFWHEGAEVTHEGFRRALLRWIDLRAEDGRPILRLDERRYAYVDVDDTPLLVVSATSHDDRITVALNDGSSEELAYDTLAVGDGDALYCRVRGGRLEARITTTAYYVIAEHIEAEGDGFALRLGDRSFPIGER